MPRTSRILSSYPHGGGARSASAGAERGDGAPASDGVGGSGGAKPPGFRMDEKILDAARDFFGM
jgi:hypothetical protein